MVFCRAEEAKLIEFVSHHPALFDIKNENYRNTVVRDKLWDKIAPRLINKTGVECRKRWRTIRDTWRRLQRKRGLDPAFEAKRPWELAPYLDFLQKVKFEKQNSTNVPNNTQLPDNNVECAIDTKCFCIDPDINHNISEGTSMNSLPSTQTEVQENLRFTLQPHQEERVKLVDAVSTSQEDDIDLFYKSLAMSVKKLPQYLRNEAKIEHLKIVMQLQKSAHTAKNSIPNLIFVPTITDKKKQ